MIMMLEMKIVHEMMFIIIDKDMKMLIGHEEDVDILTSAIKDGLPRWLKDSSYE